MQELVVEAIRNVIADTSSMVSTRYLAKQLWHSSDMRMSAKTIGEMLAASICPDRDLRQKRSTFFFSLACSVTELPPPTPSQFVGVATEAFKTQLPPEYLSGGLNGKVLPGMELRYDENTVRVDRAVADMFQSLPHLR
jgi:hypothetical protein